jgi:hypothetical protein
MFKHPPGSPGLVRRRSLILTTQMNSGQRHTNIFTIFKKWYAVMFQRTATSKVTTQQRFSDNVFWNVASSLCNYRGISSYITAVAKNGR